MKSDKKRKKSPSGRELYVALLKSTNEAAKDEKASIKKK